MKKILTIIMALALSLVLSLDTYAALRHGLDGRKLTGKVTDSETGRGLEFVTVALRDSSTAVIAAATTDSTGVYVLALPTAFRADGCHVEFSLVGYRDAGFALDGISGPELPHTSLSPDSQALESAKVVGKRPLLEHRFDNIVMNVSELAVAKTGNATDVLRAAPGVTFDKDGNIQLNGKSVSVWLDGRPSNMSGKELQAYLKGSSGTTIDKIEVIASPSSKYDAEGAGGIINIKTKRGLLRGFNGSVSGTGQFKWEPKIHGAGDGSVRLGYKGDVTNTNLSYNGYIYPSYNDVTEDKRYGDSYESLLKTSNNAKSRFLGHQIMLSEDIRISESDVLGAIAKVNLNNYGYDAPNAVMVDDFRKFDDAEPYTGMTGNSAESTMTDQYSANINYTHTFDETISQEITVNADYNHTRSNVSNLQRNLYTALSSEAQADRNADIAAGLPDPFIGNGLNDSTFRRANIWALKVDFAQNLWDNTGRVEAGAKAAVSVTDNRYSSYKWDPSTPQEQVGDLSARNDFTYSEQIYALYANLSKAFSAKWNAQVGLRGEYTIPRGNWKSENRRSGRNYFDVFPNVFLNWTPSQKAILSLNYSYRLNRPKYWQLNPFRSYVNPTTWSVGDPELKPSYSHNLTLSSVFLGNLTLTAGYSHLKNYTDQQVPIYDKSSGTMEYRFSNAGVQQTAYLALALSEQNITKWWTVTLNANYSYGAFKAYPNPDITAFADFSNSSHAFNGYASTTFYLPKEFKISVDGWGMTPMTAGYFTVAALYSVNASISKSFLDGRANLTISANDIFRSMNQNLSIMDGDIETMKTVNNSYSRGISLGFTYSFGKAVTPRRNVGNFEESSRL